MCCWILAVALQSLPQNDDVMNRLPIDEVYLLNSLFGIRNLSEEEQTGLRLSNMNIRPGQIYSPT